MQAGNNSTKIPQHNDSKEHKFYLQPSNGGGAEGNIVRLNAFIGEDPQITTMFFLNPNEIICQVQTDNYQSLRER